jgi:class 3 adenylate cyclase
MIHAKRRATYVALRDLCVNVLDPVIDHFGRIELEFATIGDTVNVASRLELITRDLAA